tara:strand:- start:22694 stop:22969 length:276 start_codon:yes stop_codon:yes gene_type:complete
MEEHIAYIQTRFPAVVELEETSNNFFRGGRLFKTSLNNDYCYIFMRSDVFISFFKSDWLPIEKIENDWLDSGISFLVTSRQETKLLVERLV